MDGTNPAQTQQPAPTPPQPNDQKKGGKIVASKSMIAIIVVVVIFIALLWWLYNIFFIGPPSPAPSGGGVGKYYMNQSQTESLFGAGGNYIATDAIGEHGVKEIWTVTYTVGQIGHSTVVSESFYQANASANNYTKTMNQTYGILSQPILSENVSQGSVDGMNYYYGHSFNPNVSQFWIAGIKNYSVAFVNVIVFSNKTYNISEIKETMAEDLR